MGVPARAVGLVLGYAAYLASGDPRRGHPVAGFEQIAAALERACRVDDRARGAAYAGAQLPEIDDLPGAQERLGHLCARDATVGRGRG